MRSLRAAPTLLRIGAIETFAYRAEFVVWMLTMTMPLVMLALWSSVAAEAPFRGYAASDFVAYYLVTLIVRQVTSSWVSWQMNEEIRRGSMAMRLLRPVHPFIALACQHLAAVPLRSAVAIPVAIGLLLSSGSDALCTNIGQLVWIVPSIMLAWLITFAMMLSLGSLALYFTKATSAADIYFGLYAVLSGYTLPLALLPKWLGNAAQFTPFPSVLAHPVAIVARSDLGVSGAAWLVATQLLWAAIVIACTLFIWRRGLRRFEAVGG